MVRIRLMFRVRVRIRVRIRVRARVRIKVRVRVRVRVMVRFKFKVWVRAQFSSKTPGVFLRRCFYQGDSLLMEKPTLGKISSGYFSALNIFIFQS